MTKKSKHGKPKKISIPENYTTLKPRIEQNKHTREKYTFLRKFPFQRKFQFIILKCQRNLHTQPEKIKHDRDTQGRKVM